MKKNGQNMTSERYISLFLGLTAVVCAAAMLFMYGLDPWLYYRIHDHRKYWLDGAYTSAGVIKNRKYDTAVIGSSYFQDFRMDWFRQKLKCEPVNLTVPGLDLYETAELSKAVVREGKAGQQIICLAYYTFEEEIERRDRIPEYLLDDKKWNNIEYLFSYEAWIKFMPLDIATYILDKTVPSLLEKYSSMMDPDKLGNELQRYVFSEEEVMRGFHIPAREGTKKIAYLSNLLKENFHQYIEIMELDQDTDYLFVLPPHSALYWYYLEKKGLLDTYFRFEEYVVSQFSSYDNIRVINAQTFPEITDLNHYRDTTHYDLTVQEKIVDTMQGEDSVLHPGNVKEKQKKLLALIEEFKIKYEVE